MKGGHDDICGPDIKWPGWPKPHNKASLVKRLSDIAGSSVWTVRKDPKRSFVHAIEERLAHETGCRHAILVASGTVAVEIAVRTVLEDKRREVIVPALGWHATAAAARRAGAHVRFADVERATGCLCPHSVSEVVTSETVAILPVHLHCCIADLDALSAIAVSSQAKLIEDAAQAHGAAYRGAAIGAVGDIGCFSYNQEKLIPAGEGGAIITGDAELAERIFAMRTDGYRLTANGDLEPNGIVAGYNAAMSDFQAAVLEDQMNGHAELHRRRANSMTSLRHSLDAIDEVSLIETSSETTERAYYEAALVVSDKGLGSLSLDEFAHELSLLTGMHVSRTDKPVMVSPLYNPAAIDTVRVPPNAAWLYDHLIVIHHRYLLSPRFTEVLTNALKRTLAFAR